MRLGICFILLAVGTVRLFGAEQEVPGSRNDEEGSPLVRSTNTYVRLLFTDAERDILLRFSRTNYRRRGDQRSRVFVTLTQALSRARASTSSLDRATIEAVIGHPSKYRQLDDFQAEAWYFAWDGSNRTSSLVIIYRVGLASSAGVGDWIR